MDFVFLRAEWRHLAMLNYAVDPAVLRPLVPPGTELDSFEGTTYVSVVGFQFLRTKVLGLALPFHRDFEEVNLRFYVRAKEGNEWRRGVVFVRELVPRFAIAWVARTFYGEPYSALPMRHRVESASSAFSARYEWRRAGQWEAVEVSGEAPAEEIAAGSLAEFITEHYWGYTLRRAQSASTQYQVEHPRWRVRVAREARLEAEIAGLYGAGFAESLAAPPASAFLAEGSPVAVRFHRRHGALGTPIS